VIKPTQMNWTSLLQKLQHRFGDSIREMVPLSEYTSFGIGGPARLLATVSDADSAAALIREATDLDIPLLVLGGGTNLLVSDEGFDGLAIHMDFGKVAISRDTATVTAGASVPVTDLVNSVISNAIGGMEFAAGLPGSVGGAIAGNAGCFGSCFGDILTSALVLHPDGTLQRVPPAFFDFEYRRTRVGEQRVIVLEAEFVLAHGNIEELRATAAAHLDLRRTRHPSRDIRTAGSYFKNLPPLHPGEHRRAAGALLEQVGAKQMSVGDAAVFEKHANILINRGNATARQMLTLEHMLKQKVFDAFGVTLEPEVRFIGTRPSTEQ